MGNRGPLLILHSNRKSLKIEGRIGLQGALSLPAIQLNNTRTKDVMVGFIQFLVEKYISPSPQPRTVCTTVCTAVCIVCTVCTVVVVVDSHIQRIVLATEETTVTQQVSHRPIKCQSRSWSQRGTKVNGSHHGDNPLLRPTGIQIATKSYAALQAMAPTNQHQNGSSNLLTPYREQLRSTRNVAAYPRPAFSAKNRKHYAPTSFDQQVPVSRGHTLYRNKKK